MRRSLRPFAGVEPSREVGEAAWLVERIRDFTEGDGGFYRVGSIVPSGFAAYVRIDPIWGSVTDEPWEGGFLDVDAVALARVLAGGTGTPDRCWFGLWDGFGGTTGSWTTMVAVLDEGDRPTAVLKRSQMDQEVLQQEAEAKRAVREVVKRCGRFHAPDRTYLLFTGPVSALAWASDDAASPWQLPSVLRADGGEDDDDDDDDEPVEPTPLNGPNLWWPADRAWVVASEIDLAWTYVGGSEALVEAMLADDRFPTRRVAVTDPIVDQPFDDA